MPDSGPTPIAPTPCDRPPRADGHEAAAQPDGLVRDRAVSSAPESPAVSAPAGQLTRGRRAGLLLTLLLGSLTALPPLSMDLYLPALPAVGDELSSPAAQVQLTLTTCLLGLAIGQIVAGPMSDQFGRRRPLLVGLVCYVLASAACALAPTIETFTGFRLLQGLAGAAGIVIARAVVRDMFDGLAMARFFSTLLLISGAAPVLAPVLGGQVLLFTNWRGIFVILAVIGLLLSLVCLRWLPETLPPDARHSGGVPSALRSMRTLLRDRVFSGYLLVGSLSFAALFAYVAASPFVMQEIFQASPQTFSLLFMINAAGLVVVGQLNGRLLVGRVRLELVLSFGLAVIGTAAVALLLITSGVFAEPTLVSVSVGLFVLMSGMALVLPNANTLGLMRAEHAAGSASALLGTSQFLIGAVATPLVGVAGENTAVPMALVQLGAVLLAATFLVGMCRPWLTRS